MRKFTVVLALLVPGAHAQVWGVSAHCTSQISATAQYNVFTSSNTQPVGPMGWPGGTTASSGLFEGTVTTVVVGPVAGSSAPLTFRAEAQVLCRLSLGNTGSGSGGGSARLTLSAPQPVAGRLWLRLQGQGGRVTVDLGGDGVIDAIAESGAVSRDVPLQIPATGVHVDLTFAVNFFGAGYTYPSTYSGAGAGVYAEFFPNSEPIVEPFASFPGAAALSISHGAADSLGLNITGSGLSPIVMAFGAAPINVPWLQYVTLLASPDILLWNTGAVAFRPGVFPPGTAIYVQGLALDAGSTPRATNSVRLLWH